MISHSVSSIAAASPEKPSLSSRPAHNQDSGHPPILVCTLAGGHTRVFLEGLSERGYVVLGRESGEGVADDWGSWRCRPGSRLMMSCGLMCTPGLRGRTCRRSTATGLA